MNETTHTHSRVQFCVYFTLLVALAVMINYNVATSDAETKGTTCTSDMTGKIMLIVED